MRLTTIRRFPGRPVLAPRGIAARWSSSAPEPLRILFCGSDDFSCTALQALVGEMKTNPRLIAEIQVVTRPDKR